MATTTDTIGDTGTHSASWNGFVRVYQITASGAGVLASVGIDIQSAGSGNVRTGIYTDNAGAPGTLLGESADTVPSTNWNDLPITGVSIGSGTKYWIGFQAANNSLDVYRTSAATTLVSFVAQAYGAFPASPTWSNATVTIPNLRMTYSSGITAAAAPWWPFRAG